eukprot:scaffold4166_cov98-Skeletonema_menzelii.AAC.1
MVAMRVAAIMVHAGSIRVVKASRSTAQKSYVRYVAYDLVCSDSAARFCSPLAKIIRTQKICSDSPSGLR